MKPDKFKKVLNYLKGGNLFGEISNDDLISIEELVEKETQMKPIFVTKDLYRSCGNCKNALISTHNWIPNYCSSCGQLIEWKKENE